MANEEETIILPLEKTQAALDIARAKYEGPGERLAIVTPERYQEVKTIFADHFVPDEPLSRAYGATYDVLIDKLVDETLISNLSVCIISEETNEMMGFRLVGVMRKSDPPLDFAAYPGCKYVNVFQYVFLKDDEVDFFNRYKLEEAIHFLALGVHSKFRKRGLGSKLLGAAASMCRELGYKAIRGEGTSNFSQKIYEKEGFEILARMPYNEFKMDDGVLLSERTGPHTCTKVYGYRV